MASNINTVSISGRLTRDPELRSTNSGKAVAQIGVAVNKTTKNGEEWVDTASFFDVIVWERQGELVAEKAQKGDFVFVHGRLEQRSWDGDNGEKRSKVEIIAERVEGEFQFRPKADTGAETGGQQQTTQAAADDDIPF